MRNKLKFNKYNFIKSKNGVYLSIYLKRIENIKVSTYIIKYNKSTWEYNRRFDAERKYSLLTKDKIINNISEIEMVEDLILTKLKSISPITINNISTIQNIIYYYYTKFINYDFIYIILDMYDYIDAELLLDNIASNGDLLTSYYKRRKDGI